MDMAHGDKYEARTAALVALGSLFDGRMTRSEYEEMYESAVASKNRVYAQAYKAATYAIIRIMEGQ